MHNVCVCVGGGGGGAIVIVACMAEDIACVFS